MTVSPAIARRLTKEAIALNKSLGNPQDDAKSKSKSAPRKKKRETCAPLSSVGRT
jgi:hypothetical protein